MTPLPYSDARLQLALVEPEATPEPTRPVLERITDPIAREAYRKRIELGVSVWEDWMKRGGYER